MECVIETKANVILDFINGLRGELHVTLKQEKVRPLQECFFLTSPLQKPLHVCASVIRRPSLLAFFLRYSICWWRYLCS